eukprot:1042454-Pelagomonas_calceolata.AAC.5
MVKHSARNLCTLMCMHKQNSTPTQEMPQPDIKKKLVNLSALLQSNTARGKTCGLHQALAGTCLPHETDNQEDREECSDSS